MTCAPLLDQAWNARWRRQATDCPAPPRRVLMLKRRRSTVGLVDVTCGRLVYRDLGGRLTKTVPLTEEVRVSIKGKKGYGFWFHCSFVGALFCVLRNAAWTAAGRTAPLPDDAAVELVLGLLTTR